MLRAEKRRRILGYLPHQARRELVLWVERQRAFEIAPGGCFVSCIERLDRAHRQLLRLALFLSRSLAARLRLRLRFRLRLTDLLRLFDRLCLGLSVYFCVRRLRACSEQPDRSEQEQT
jgi:hypothetical protein